MNTRAYKLFSRFRDLLAHAEARIADSDLAMKVLQASMRHVLEAESAPEDEEKIFSWCCCLIDARAATLSLSKNGVQTSLAS